LRPRTLTATAGSCTHAATRIGVLDKRIARPPLRMLRAKSNFMERRISVKAVEYPITEHCNLSCAHCDHASPMFDTRFADVEDFRRDVNAAARAVHADEFLVIGGEPLLHPRLLDFIEIARESNISRGVTLVTNGTLLHTANPRMWTMIDKLWLSVYPKVESRIDLDAVTRTCTEHGIVLDRRNTKFFRQTLINTKIDDPDVVQTIYDHCALAHEWHCYTIYLGRFYKCAPAPFMKARVRMRGEDLDDSADGVAIHGEPDLAERIREYLDDTRPLAACTYCLGSSGRYYRHRQLNKREVLEAIARDDGPVETLIDIRTLRRPALRGQYPAFHLDRTSV
jgi:organic radical activating enzyme